MFVWPGDERIVAPMLVYRPAGMYIYAYARGRDVYDICGKGLYTNIIEREVLIDNLLVRIHLTVKMILVDRSCVLGV